MEKATNNTEEISLVKNHTPYKLCTLIACAYWHYLKGGEYTWTLDVYRTGEIEEDTWASYAFLIRELPSSETSSKNRTRWLNGSELLWPVKVARKVAGVPLRVVDNLTITSDEAEFGL